MKRYLNFLPALAWVFATASCVDDAVLPYAVKKPESIAQYEYLNDYNVLKSYIDRSKYPDFKLGLAVDASDFINKGAIYETVTTNFDEMTAGNAMKYSWCVGDDGSMNFSTVSKFVEMARAAGVTIYGHTLAWHAQQNNKYLNSLIKDKELEVDPDAPALEIFTDIVSNGDAEGSDTKNFVSTHIGSSHAACDIVDGVGVDGSRAFVVTSNGGNANSWDTQFFVYSERPFMENDVVLISFDYRADVPNSSDSQTQSTPGNYLWWDGGCGVNFTSEWQHFEKKMTISADQSQSGQMQTFAWNLEGGAPNME